jgi:hypothetical protein
VTTEGQPAHLAVVHRDFPDVFNYLRRNFAEDRGSVDVIWDRRVIERRRARVDTPVDRRRTERRGPPPSTWTSLSMLIVPHRHAS